VEKSKASEGEEGDPKTHAARPAAYMADRPCGNPKQWPVFQHIDYVRAYAWEN
jgi:hypothetical protein